MLLLAYQWISWNKHLLEGRVKCLLLLTPLPKQINPQKTENHHEVLQIAQERSDLSSVVCRLLGPENPYEPMQLLAGQYVSHHLPPPSQKILFPKFCEPSPQHLLQTTTVCYWYEFISLQYSIKAMELLCYNRNSQVKNQLLILHRKCVIQLHQQKANF